MSATNHAFARDLEFLIAPLGSTIASTQTITLANNSAANLNDLTLSWLASSGANSDTGQTDFTNLPDFVETDNCVPGGESLPGGTTGPAFSLATGQACAITITFAPQASCTWLPGLYGGVSPSVCPLALTAELVVNYPPSAVTNDFLCPSSSTGGCKFAVPIAGTGLSLVQASTPELDFSAEAFGEASLPQALSFTNSGATPAQILPYAPCTVSAIGGQVPLTRPLVYPPGPPSPQFPAVSRPACKLWVLLFRTLTLQQFSTTATSILQRCSRISRSRPTRVREHCSHLSNRAALRLHLCRSQDKPTFRVSITSWNSILSSAPIPSTIHRLPATLANSMADGSLWN